MRPIDRMIAGAGLLALSAAPAAAQALDASQRPCLQVTTLPFDWITTSQLHCLRDDPNHTRRDPLGGCQEHRFQFLLKNACDKPVTAVWRFSDQHKWSNRDLGPGETVKIHCNELSQRCKGAPAAYSVWAGAY